MSMKKRENMKAKKEIHKADTAPTSCGEGWALTGFAPRELREKKPIIIKTVELELCGENARVIKTEITREMLDNGAKCKELFSNKGILWQNIEILFSGYETKYGNIYISKCKDCSYFTHEVLRRSYLLEGGLVPSGALAFSENKNTARARLLCFNENQEVGVIEGALTVIAWSLKQRAK